VLFDANGANTTAAAAVLAAARHVELKGAAALVLAGTGPVGQRAARLLARHGADVRIGSRQQAQAAAVCEEIGVKVQGANLQPVATGSEKELRAALAGRTVVIAAGAAGAVLFPRSARAACPGMQVAIDLNAVP